MKTVKIIARQEIINATTGMLHDDTGLKALNGYCEQYVEVEDVQDITTVIDKFIVDNPNYRSANFEIDVIN